MSYMKLLHIAIAFILLAFVHKAHSKLTLFSPVGASQGFLNISSSHTQANSLSATRSTKEPPIPIHKSTSSQNDGNRQSLIPISEIAKNVKSLIEEYTKLRNLAQKQGSQNRYDELLKDANDLAKEIEDASHKHDELRLEQTQKGNTESGAQADRLTEIIQSRTEPFNSLLWRMDQVIAEIKQGDTVVPDKTPHEGIPPTSKLVALTARAQPPEEFSAPKHPCDDEEEVEDIKPKALQSFKGKDDVLEDIVG